MKTLFNVGALNTEPSGIDCVYSNFPIFIFFYFQFLRGCLFLKKSILTSTEVTDTCVLCDALINVIMEIFYKFQTIIGLKIC